MTYTQGKSIENMSYIRGFDEFNPFAWLFLLFRSCSSFSLFPPPFLVSPFTLFLYSPFLFFRHFSCLRLFLFALALISVSFSCSPSYKLHQENPTHNMHYFAVLRYSQQYITIEYSGWRIMNKIVSLQSTQQQQQKTTKRNNSIIFQVKCLKFVFLANKLNSDAMTFFFSLCHFVSSEIGSQWLWPGSRRYLVRVASMVQLLQTWNWRKHAHWSKQRRKMEK